MVSIPVKQQPAAVTFTLTPASEILADSAVQSVLRLCASPELGGNGTITEADKLAVCEAYWSWEREELCQ